MIADETEKIDLTGLEWRRVDDSGNLDFNGNLDYSTITVQPKNFHGGDYYLPIPASEVKRVGNLEQKLGLLV